MELIRIAAAWVMLGLLTISAGIILYRMATREINLTKLISEQDGTASMARFQLLIFTFVIAMSVFYVTIAPDSAGLPEIPVGVLTLLGVSASSYGVGKLLQSHRDTELAKTGGKQDDDHAGVKVGEPGYSSPLGHTKAGGPKA
jgi:uncharacterized BrkB/YihY/UPF0761 family membrane protein